MSTQNKNLLQEIAIQLQAGGNVPSELREIFCEEAEDHQRTIYDGLNRIKENPNDHEALASVRRASHTLKGAAGAVGLEVVTRLAHRMEDLLDRLVELDTGATAEQTILMLTTADQIQELTADNTDTDSMAQQLVELYAAYARQMEQLGAVANDVPCNRQPESISQSLLPSPAVQTAPVDAEIKKSASADQYLRVPLGRLDELVTGIGEMVVNRSAMAQRLGEFENRVAELTDAVERLRETSRNLEDRYCASSNRSAGQWAIDERPCFERRRPTGGDNIRRAAKMDSLEFDQYTDFHLLSRSLEEGNSDIGIVVGELKSLRSEFDGLLRRQEHLNRDARNSLMHIRMVPLGGIVSRLQRTVRSVSAKLKRPVELEVTGERTELDKTVLDEIVDPLLHLIRNAIDHGVESAEARAMAGKPGKARITLEAINHGTQVTILISDDGCGIDLERVREKAVQNGLIDEADELNQEELHRLIFLPGFSTAAALTDVSGRGVGMDVVRDAVSRLKGTIHVDSEQGIGTTFTIQLPTSIGVARALIVESSGNRYAIPMQVVKKIQRLYPGSVNFDDPQPKVELDGQSLSVNDLASHLQLDSIPLATKLDHARPLLVIHVGDHEVAMTVDSIHGGQDMAIKTLGDHLRNVPGLIGATIWGDGSIIPVLDPVDLAGASTRIASAPHFDVAPQNQVRVSTAMVIDDSISVRRVTTNLLQLAGWDVITAKDGVDALEKLAELETAPDVFLCDMEMPGMNGIDLIKQLRKQPEFVTTPIVMVTSRASEKHRHMAVDAGATEYVVKPYNDEMLLALIDEQVQLAWETVSES